MLVMMQVSKKIPFDNPDVLFGVRSMYIASNVLIAVLYFYVHMQINKKKGWSDLAGLRVGWTMYSMHAKY